MTFRDDVKQRLIAYRNPPEVQASAATKRLLEFLAEAYAELEKKIAANEKNELEWMKVEIYNQ